MIKKLIQVFIATLFIFNTSVFAKSTRLESKDTNKTHDQAVLTTNWQQSAEAKATYYQTFNLARWRLDEILRTYNLNKLPAIVIAIDNTILDSPSFTVKHGADKHALEQSLMTWYQAAKAKPLPGALNFLNYVNSQNVNIFYVTDRPVSEKEATLQNLKKYGFPQVKDTHLFFKIKGESKEDRRQTISATYEIIMLVGDRLSDLSSSFDNNSSHMRIAEVDKIQNNLGKNLFLLPNPGYGG